MRKTTRRLARGGVLLAASGLALAAFGAAPASAAGPATTVTPATGADPDGQDLAVRGSGFDPTANNRFGVYVVFGPKRDDYATNANAYQASKWVHLGATPSPGQDVMNADGTFDITLPGIKAAYTDGDGNHVDCLTTRCYVITMAAHGVPDRSQDSFTPVTFTGGENPTDPGDPGNDPGTPAGTGRQTLTTTVRNGALTLALDGDTAQLSEVAPGRHSTGALRTATVTDARGTQAGWSLVGEVTDFGSAAGGSIPASVLTWSPTAAVVDDGSRGTVTAGTAGSLGAPRTLASSAAGASGGVFQAGAGLDLGVPAGTAPGDYTATLTLTLS
ncbi:WxL domain-containing protein [Actinomadura madurae]|uniref:WxL domain-containing protein n=1 Tax=Actinomadura madurae TaxID=1993 RepID=UPI0020260F2C|nr:WxL domain-containing protein [Actinomadura madurae]URM96678.1 WxL domain-containing protein [Actinomadura madurae]URN07361.1 WxL domain-containing protein [Actinomadura madurae]